MLGLKRRGLLEKKYWDADRGCKIKQIYIMRNPKKRSGEKNRRDVVMRRYKRIEDRDDRPILRRESWKSIKSGENSTFENI